MTEIAPPTLAELDTQASALLEAYKTRKAAAQVVPPAIAPGGASDAPAPSAPPGGDATPATGDEAGTPAGESVAAAAETAMRDRLAALHVEVAASGFIPQTRRVLARALRSAVRIGEDGGAVLRFDDGTEEPLSDAAVRKFRGDDLNAFLPSAGFPGSGSPRHVMEAHPPYNGDFLDSQKKFEAERNRGAKFRRTRE